MSAEYERQRMAARLEWLWLVADRIRYGLRLTSRDLNHLRSLSADNIDRLFKPYPGHPDNPRNHHA